MLPDISFIFNFHIVPPHNFTHDLLYICTAKLKAPVLPGHHFFNIRIGINVYVPRRCDHRLLPRGKHLFTIPASYFDSTFQQGDPGFGHYIQTIARNLIISLLRKKIHHDSFESSATGDLQENSWKPSQQLEAKEITELIKKAVNRLSPKQKQIYLLSSEKQLSLKELAAELNISYDTARQYKSEALKFIRGFLAENACQLPFFIITTLFL